MKVWMCGLGVVVWLTSLLAQTTSARTVIDDLGFRVVVGDNIQRVVSLVPTNSEMVCLLDCDRLVGGTRYDFYPAQLPRRMARKQVAEIGGGFDANLEKIVQLQPDLILTNGPTQQRFAVPLKNLGYTVISLWPRDVEGLKKDFLLLGDLFGQQHKARQFIDDMEQRFRTIAAKAKNKPKPRVYLQMWTSPLITVGKASFTDWLVNAAGGVNVFADMAFDSGQVNLEALIQRNPDVLVFLAEQKPFAQSLRSRPGWAAIRGVRDGNFCFIDEPDIRRSIQFLDGLEKLHACLSKERP